LAEVGRFTLYQVNYVQGTHSAAQENNWDAIAKFLIEREQDDFTQSPFYRNERRLEATVFGGKLTAIAVWSLIFFGVYGIYLASAAVISFFVQNNAAAEQLFLSGRHYAGVIYKILTKV